MKVDDCGISRGNFKLSADMARASYSATSLLRSLVHRPQSVILVNNADVFGVIIFLNDLFFEKIGENTG